MSKDDHESEKKKRTDHDTPPQRKIYESVEPLPPKSFTISIPNVVSWGVIASLIGGFWTLLVFGFSEYRRLSTTIEEMREQIIELRVTSATMKDQLDTCRKDLDQVENHLFEHEENNGEIHKKKK